MKIYQRFFLLLLCALFATCLLTPWAVAFWNYVLAQVPEWERYRYPFSRIFDRLFMISGIVFFLLWRSRLQIDSLAEVGLGPTRHGYPDAARGFALAAGSLIALALLMVAAGIFTPYFRLPFAVGAERAVKAILAAVTVGVLEEIFFRGILLKGTLGDLKPVTAWAATNLFFSAVHFVRPSKRLTTSGLDPLAGFRHVIYSFEPFLDPLELLPGVFGLFLVGLVLSFAYRRTGSLFLSIGLHAGWVFTLKTFRVFGDYRRDELGWLFGGSEPKLVSGAATWAMLALVAHLVHAMTRGRAGPARNRIGAER